MKKVALWIIVVLLLCSILPKPIQVQNVNAANDESNIEVWAVSGTEPSYPVVIAKDNRVLIGAPIFENLEHYYGTLGRVQPMLESFDTFIRDMIRGVSENPQPSVAIYEPDMLDNLEDSMAAPND